MVDFVPQSPELSRPGPDAPPSVGLLVRSLFTVLSRHALRLNAAFVTDGSNRMTAPLKLAEYTTGALPAAVDWPGTIVYDSTTGQVKRSNGTAWAAL